ncbi:MAG: LuxR C-terminal-related transcriptional regulator, partial [Anaerolineales bacterium]
LRDRHLAYFAVLSKRAEEGILTPDNPKWVARTAAEIDNIRSALQWSLDEGAIEIGFRIAIALFQFWQEAGIASESIAIYQALLDSPKAADPTLLQVRGMASALLCLSHLRLADHQKAIQAADAALAEGEALGDLEIKAYALVGLGHAYGLEERYPESRASLEQSLALFRGMGHIRGQCWALSRLGAVHLYMGEYAEADYCLQEVAELARQSEITTYLGFALRYVSYARLYQGDISDALQKLQEAQTCCLVPGVYNAANLVAFAAIAIATGQIVRAARLSGAVQRQIEIQHVLLLPYDLDRHQSNQAALREWLGETVYLQAMQAGSRMTGAQLADEIAAIRVSSTRSTGAHAYYPAGLTEREVEVLRFVTLGLSNKAIAERLVISPRTVHAHMRSIFNKLDVSTRTAAARKATRLKLD